MPQLYVVRSHKRATFPPQKKRSRSSLLLPVKETIAPKKRDKKIKPDHIFHSPHSTRVHGSFHPRLDRDQHLLSRVPACGATARVPPASVVCSVTPVRTHPRTPTGPRTATPGAHARTRRMGCLSRFALLPFPVLGGGMASRVEVPDAWLRCTSHVASLSAQGKRRRRLGRHRVVCLSVALVLLPVRLIESISILVIIIPSCFPLHSATRTLRPCPSRARSLPKNLSPLWSLGWERKACMHADAGLSIMALF